MTLYGENKADYETNFAAECLLAMSFSRPDEKTVGTKPSGSGADENANYAVPPDMECDRNQPAETFMLARILTDLKQFRQEPVDSLPVYEDDAPHPTELHNYHSLSGSKARRGKGTGTTPTYDWSAKSDKLSKNDAKKLHRCQYKDCDKVYGKSSHLKAHLRTHTGKRNRSVFAVLSATDLKRAISLFGLDRMVPSKGALALASFQTNKKTPLSHRIPERAEGERARKSQIRVVVRLVDSVIGKSGGKKRCRKRLGEKSIMGGRALAISCTEVTSLGCEESAIFRRL